MQAGFQNYFPRSVLGNTKVLRTNKATLVRLNKFPLGEQSGSEI
jgi:hypothetical protein